MALTQVQGYYPQGTRLTSRQAYAGVTGWFAFHQAVRINQALGNRAAVGREVVAVWENDHYGSCGHDLQQPQQNSVCFKL